MVMAMVVMVQLQVMVQVQIHMQDTGFNYWCNIQKPYASIKCKGQVSRCWCCCKFRWWCKCYRVSANTCASAGARCTTSASARASASVPASARTNAIHVRANTNVTSNQVCKVIRMRIHRRIISQSINFLPKKENNENLTKKIRLLLAVQFGCHSWSQRPKR